MHDPIPYDHIAELIGDTESSLQSAVLHDVWREYAATAARPYAWKTFALYARQQLMETGDWTPHERGKAKLTPWQDGARASPCVLVLGAYAALRVRAGNRAWASRRSADDLYRYRRRAQTARDPFRQPRRIHDR